MSLLDKRFCVYLHKRKDNGEVFYVGSGNAKRPYERSKSQRGKAWGEVVSVTEFEVEVVKEGLTKEESVNLECELIKSGQYSLVNKTIPVNTRKVTREMFSDRFKYSDESPSGLLKNNQVYLCQRPGNGWVVGIGKAKYPAHRVIWALIHGECPTDKVVDHIDGDNLNNKIDNLRLVTYSANNKNRRPETKNPVGIQECERWFVVRDSDGKSRSVNKEVFGSEMAKLLCCEYRLRLFRQGYFLDFTERHMGFNEPYLPDMPQEELLEKINRSNKLVANNTSGANGVVTDGRSWTYQGVGSEKVVRFSSREYGDELAKFLAFELQAYYEGIRPGLHRLVHQRMSRSITGNNTSGLPGMSFETSNNGQGVAVSFKLVRKGQPKVYFQKTCHSFHDMIKTIKEFKIRSEEYK